MARSIQTIYNEIIASVQADTNLYDPSNPDPNKRGLTSTSRVAIWRLWAWIVATAQALLEQLIDTYKVEIETIVDQAPSGNALWLQRQVFKFQYSATDPQIVQLDTILFFPYYTTISENQRIVTQCSVTTLPNKIVSVKVAKGGSNPIPLDATELSALTSYLSFINFAGVYFNLISDNPDLMYLGVDVYYNGAYSGVIQANVETAINNYLTNANANSFNYTAYLSKIVDVIQGVEGVNDVVLKQVEVRPHFVSVANAYIMVDNYQTFIRQYNPYAGYMIPDTAGGRTLADSITYVINNN
jgi:hypothetical protein